MADFISIEIGHTALFPDLEGGRPAKKKFKNYRIGFFDGGIAPLCGENGQRGIETSFVIGWPLRRTRRFHAA